VKFRRAVQKNDLDRSVLRMVTISSSSANTAPGVGLDYMGWEEETNCLLATVHSLVSSTRYGDTVAAYVLPKQHRAGHKSWHTFLLS
jgi:hypothetical protein